MKKMGIVLTPMRAGMPPRYELMGKGGDDAAPEFMDPNAANCR